MSSSISQSSFSKFFFSFRRYVCPSVSPLYKQGSEQSKKVMCLGEDGDIMEG